MANNEAFLQDMQDELTEVLRPQTYRNSRYGATPLKRGQRGSARMDVGIVDSDMNRKLARNPAKNGVLFVAFETYMTHATVDSYSMY